VTNSLEAYLTLSGILFAIGSFGFLARRNAISMLMSIELMLNAVNLSAIAFGAFVPALPGRGAVIALLVMAVAAAEATVGLAIVIAIYLGANIVYLKALGRDGLAASTAVAADAARHYVGEIGRAHV